MPSDTQPLIAVAIQLQHAVPWHHSTFEGIMRYGREHGWDCRIDPFLAGPAGTEELKTYTGVVGRLDGELSQMVVQNDLPAVNLITNRSSTDLPGVRIDSYAGGAMIAEHLMSCGYKRFGHIVDRQSKAGERNIRGMTDWLESHGIEDLSASWTSSAIEAGRQNNITIRQQMTQWLKSTDKPLGVMVQNVTVSRYLAQVCLEMGLRVPEDVGIVVHDGDQVIVNNASPTISSVEYDFYRQGYKAAGMLDRFIKGDRSQPHHRLIKPSRVIVRESSDVFVCEDPLVSAAMRFIAEHVRTNLSVEQVAEHLNVGERTLRRRFEQALGQTVFDEVKRLRIAYTQRLLLETDRSITNIAKDCDFSSTSHFARYFKSATGQSPSQFRRPK